MYNKILKCRVCGNKNLLSILKLGEQALTGVFPKSKTEKITSGPLELIKCAPIAAEAVCGLVQLGHSYDTSEMYGNNYGYRSGLNQSMVNHLQVIVKNIFESIELQKDDLIIDIGSNDSTLLRSYPNSASYHFVGIDPGGAKFKKYYPSNIELIADFFSAQNIRYHFPNKKARIITSIAMFYDLENPMVFANDIFEILDDNGIWVFEQSYLPSMLKTNSYDTVCHEHLEYYCLRQIKWIMDKVGFKIIDVVFNEINGGSFRITVAKKELLGEKNNKKINAFFLEEEHLKLDGESIFMNFNKNIKKHRNDLCKIVKEINEGGKKIFGYGASTKGNVILQYCGFSDKDIPFIAEVNEDKFGAFTPFTHIPIISEKEAKAMNPDYFLVLPWHFRENIIKRENDFIKSGGKLLFPLPEIEIYKNPK